MFSHVANKERYFYMSQGGVFAITKPINKLCAFART